ncbi:ribosyldihydronicotinamide dehydrogenase [quinone]-like [Orycteropus afer afer]|uniref:Ribosyldihydronicotinamide dehydrogenase [quinone]-like n=1 Tax=Orycteropus afer afer TaxID=1230840 RepID=A0A8B6ZD67_ORYAF|nr:ribosyldihydronicotinamide dehydrogenase [quinone]-like [Orycteropus afer afer]
MSGKKVLIVNAHQVPSSLDGSLKSVAEDELSRQGCMVTVSDLYTMDFEPRATGEDIWGVCSNLKCFSYGIEAYETCKKRSLARDIMDEQKKVQEADLVIFQGKLAVSLTRGDQVWNDMKDSVNADSQAYLWPLPHGVLYLCGFKVLAPQISSAPNFTSEEEKNGMVASWAQRLKTIWTEEPIKPRCTLKLL